MYGSDAVLPKARPNAAVLPSVLSQHKADRCPVFRLPLQVQEVRRFRTRTHRRFRSWSPCPGHAPTLSPGLPQGLPVSVPGIMLPGLDIRHQDRYSQAVEPGIRNGLARVQSRGTDACQPSDNQSPHPLLQARTQTAGKEIAQQTGQCPGQLPDLMVKCRILLQAETEVAPESHRPWPGFWCEASGAWVFPRRGRIPPGPPPRTPPLQPFPGCRVC